MPRPVRRLGERLALVARDPDEGHRASTPLELLFDLTFVVAVAQAGAELHHDLSAGHAAHGVISYVSVFFAIWWAWMNFTWFASAYDADDVPYRLLTLVQMAGVLVLAAGIPSAFESMDFRGVTLGYLIMRIGLVAQWLRAAAGDAARRPIALRYVAGVVTLQAGWLLRLALPSGLAIVSFLLLVAGEIVVPLWAERAAPMTPWHPEHIAERYGLFTLIVLGESILAATNAVQTARNSAGAGDSAGVLLVAVAGLTLVFSLWWIYFGVEAGEGLRGSPESAFPWGYGHFAIFAAVAALGAGLQVAAETVARSAASAGADAQSTSVGIGTHEGIGALGAALAIAVPVAVFLAVIGLLDARLGLLPKPLAVALGEAALVLLAAGTAYRLPLPVAALLVAAVPALGIATLGSVTLGSAALGITGLGSRRSGSAAPG